jgi:hypothetical protein
VENRSHISYTIRTKKYGGHMKTNDTCNVRIKKQTRERLKLKCKKEARLMGGYVDMILNKAIAEESIEPLFSRDSSPLTDNKR